MCSFLPSFLSIYNPKNAFTKFFLSSSTSEKGKTVVPFKIYKNEWKYYGSLFHLSPDYDISSLLRLLSWSLFSSESQQYYNVLGKECVDPLQHFSLPLLLDFQTCKQDNNVLKGILTNFLIYLVLNSLTQFNKKEDYRLPHPRVLFFLSIQNSLHL